MKLLQSSQKLLLIQIVRLSFFVCFILENDSNAQEILKQANHLLKQRYLAHDVTIQLELYVKEMADCYQCKEPSK